MSKVSDSHFKLMAMFHHLASHIEQEGGFFTDDNLTRSEVKAVSGQLRKLSDHYEGLALKNQSINN